MIIRVNENGSLVNNQTYTEFIKNNPGMGTLKIRATSASEALPIKDVNIVVSKQIGNDTYIFFEGKTDESGMINNIKLPTPVRITDNLDEPKFTSYKIRAEYSRDKFDKTYEISLCCGSGLIQYINITPIVNMEVGNSSGN